MIINPKPRIINSQQGFALIELMMVLALLGLVLAGVYQFFAFTNRVYTDTDNKSIAIQEANLFISQIENEIRQADKPNGATNAIQINSEGKQINIYSFNSETNQYKHVSYRLNPSDETQLQKGWVIVDADPQSAAIPATGAGAWKTIVTNVDADKYSAAEKLFIDATDDTLVVAERRLIKVNLLIRDPETNRPLTVATSTMSRSGRSQTAIIASDTTILQNIKVTDIKVINTADNMEVTAIETGIDGTSKTVRALISPYNAYEPRVNWSSSDWITFDKTKTIPGLNQIITINPFVDTGGNSRTATITVSSVDENHSKSIQVTQIRERATDIQISYGSNNDVTRINDVARIASSLEVEAVVFSLSGTNMQNVSWTSNNSWLSVARGSTSSGEVQTIKTTTNNLSSRTGTITVKSADGNVSITLTITQKGLW